MRLVIAVSILLLGGFGVAQDSTEEIYMRATVRSVVPLTGFKGKAIAVDVLPRFAMMVHVQSVVPAVSDFPEGTDATLAIHSPALLFIGESPKGKTYNFSFQRTVQDGKVKFLSLAVDTESFQLEQFVGNWEIRKNPTAGRVNLTVTIVPAGNTVSGTVKFINPNGTTMESPILHPEFRGITLRQSLVSSAKFKGPTLDFQSLDPTMNWSLILTNATTGFLWGDEHELGIEEKVKKRR